MSDTQTLHTQFIPRHFTYRKFSYYTRSTFGMSDAQALQIQWSGRLRRSRTTNIVRRASQTLRHYKYSMMGVRQFETIKTVHWDANTGTLQIQYIQRARKHYKYSTRSISDAPALQIQCIQRLWLAEASDHAAKIANRYGKDGIQKTWIQKSTTFQKGIFAYKSNSLAVS